MRKTDRNHMSPDELSERTRRYGGQSRESLQIAQRLEELFPEVLRSLKKVRGARGERMALTSSEYKAKIEQYIDVLGEGLTARIQFETHRMLLQAWQSENAYHKALAQRRRQISSPPKVQPLR